MAPDETGARTEEASSHPRFHEPALLAVSLLLAVGGAVIGMRIVATLGVTPNTSIVGVMVAILLSRIPLSAFRRFRSIHRQNLIQTTISSATFGAANSLLVPLGVPVVLGMPELVVPMLVGAGAGMLIDLAMLYWLFDSRLFPGEGPWPIGIASAETILAADRGGRRAGLLGVGAAAGAAGSSGLFGGLGALTGVGSLPMAAFGIAFLGNVWALGMFGVGLLARGYGEGLAGVDFGAALIPHGVMVGAGVVALGQAVVGAVGGRRRRANRDAPGRFPGEPSAPRRTRSDDDARRGLLRGGVLYLAAAAGLAVVAGLHQGIGPGALAGWVAFAAVACVAAEFIVGLSAMQAGWFPAFATALVFLLLGLAAGFPPEAAALLVGFVASGGPAFADAGYDLKTGWYLRGHGADPVLEIEGRRQQIVGALAGLLVAGVMAAAFHSLFFEADLFPPVSRVYGAVIESGIDSEGARSLAIWAAPGALLQLAGGPDRQMGILLATGLLIVNPLAGWAVVLGLGIRLAWNRGAGTVEEEPSTVFAGGLIAGDALWGFGASLLG